MRPVSHEGLDICTFETIDGRDCRLDETTRIPVAFDGKIVGRCDDFLGETIIVRHLLPEPGASSAYAFYAHILPDRDLSVGDILPAGQRLGRIAPAGSRKTVMPPHLHLTFARADLLPPVEQLNWPLLNRLDRGVFCDPLQILRLPCRIMSDAGGTFDPNRYTACRTAAVTKANRSGA